LNSLAAIVLLSVTLANADDRPNILWIIVDDMSANFSCYGETAIETPHVDALAKRGTKFTNAYVTAPVCSTCRSAFITGMYQTSIGAHHHRSGRGEKKIHLPEGIRPIPELFQEAGYYTSITGWPGRKGRLGKTDYNFEWNKQMYDGPDWTDRKKGQPFFAQIQTPGGKLRGATLESFEKTGDRAEELFGSRTESEDVTLPPYYPNDPVLLKDWAAYLDTVRATDRMVGEVLAKLKTDGDLDNTIVLFMTDHGISHARGKQFLYDEGLHVPLVIAGPGITAGKTRVDLVEHIDIAAISLAAAGIAIPESMQARDVLAKDYQARHFVYAARDRCDETVEHMRSVRMTNYKYIRNYLHQRPHLQPNAYKDNKAILIALKRAGKEGRLNEIQARLLAASRPPEELYDLQKDAFELNNLTETGRYERMLISMRTSLMEWEESTGDHGRKPETAEMYDSDMQVYLDTLKVRRPDRLEEIEANIALMKEWAAEGK
jgi:arylsulfatase A-like enzyme